MNCRLPVKEGHPMGKRFALPSPAFEAHTFRPHPFVSPFSLTPAPPLSRPVDFLKPYFYKPPHVRAVRPAHFLLRQTDGQLLFPEHKQVQANRA
jgi:hypothetical protein